MADSLAGKRVAFLFTEGVEQVELTEPLDAVRGAGAEASLISLDALVLPGGVANPDALRTDADAVRFVRGFFEQHKPVGVICHGPSTLVEADVVRGRTLTSWPSLQTDLRNAGASWVDEEVHVDNGLLSSRKPDDLPAFCAKVVEEIAEGRHVRQTASNGEAVPGARAME